MSAVDDDYAAYDPASVAFAPAPPPAVDDGQAPDAPALPEFDPRYREPFIGLTFVGALVKKFALLGHSIVVRTLKADELLEVALLVKPYQGTIGELKAYNQAVVCMALASVDGRELPLPLGEGTDLHVWAQQRFDWLGAQYYPTTIGAIFEAYLELDQKVAEVVDAMGKALAQPG